MEKVTEEKVTEEDTAELIDVDLGMFDGEDSLDGEGGEAKKDRSDLYYTVTLNWVQQDWYI